MDRLKQKQLQEQQQKASENKRLHQEALKRLLDSQTINIVIDYCRKTLNNELTQNMSEYTPLRISQQVFNPQLNEVKKVLQQLPDQQCQLQQFLVIMLKVMNFPFQKTPYYLIGLIDMFYQIVSERKNFITYDSFFKYILGEMVSLKQEEQNTQFQVRFSEQRRQDYLLHDTGIKKIVYSKDLKSILSLDENAQMIKIYDKDMKMANKFSPTKDKHNKKFPIIIDFDYSQLDYKLGLILSDQTISIIDLKNFISKTFLEFEGNSNNQIVLPCPQNAIKMIYLQMINRWVVITQQNLLYFYDIDKYKSQNKNKQENFIEKKQIENEQLKIFDIVEIISTNTLCLIAGNEITFYNESMTEKKWKKFLHSSNITNFKYLEDKNLFYICGDQRMITIFDVNKNTGDFHIRVFDPGFKLNIIAFQVFPFLDTAIIVDEKNQVHIFNQTKSVSYQSQSYKHIVKNPKRRMQMLQINKTDFAIFETYLLVMYQEKVSIEKDIDYNFSNYWHFDKKKQVFYTAINKQIIGFSIPHGQIRKNYTKDSSNLAEYEAFFIGNNTSLFAIDNRKNLYDVFSRDQLLDGQNKNYKKKIGIEDIVRCFYDEVNRICIVVGTKSIYQVRNIGNNSFTIISYLTMEKFPKITNCYWRHNVLSLVNINSQIIQLDLTDYTVLRGSQYILPKDPTKIQDRIVICSDHDPEYGFDIILTNLNQIWLVSTQDFQKQFYIKLEDFLPYDSKYTVFSKFVYNKIDFNNSKHLFISLYDENGNLAQLQLKSMAKQFLNSLLLPEPNFRTPWKDNRTIRFSDITIQQRKIKLVQKGKFSKTNFIFFKAHKNGIKVIEKLVVEIILTLTISTDGYAKLWNNYDCLFSLKLPNLYKTLWNMSLIESLKNQKSRNKAIDILSKLQVKSQVEKSPEKLVQQSKKKKVKQSGFKINYNDPIHLQFENKQIQELIYRATNTWNVTRNDTRHLRMRATTFDKINVNPHPWRKKKQFVKIMQKASPEKKYPTTKMPRDLINLRTSLDMTQRKFVPEKKQEKLFILPELNNYVPEIYKHHHHQQEQDVQNQQQKDVQNFESCLYVKTSKNRKKINQFDQIDKEFKKRWMSLTNKKWVPKNLKQKTLTEKKMQRSKQIITSAREQKVDILDSVKRIFEGHNRQSSDTKKGRLIRIPQINIKKSEIFS